MTGMELATWVNRVVSATGPHGMTAPRWAIGRVVLVNALGLSGRCRGAGTLATTYGLTVDAARDVLRAAVDLGLIEADPRGGYRAVVQGATEG